MDNGFSNESLKKYAADSRAEFEKIADGVLALGIFPDTIMRAAAHAAAALFGG